MTYTPIHISTIQGVLDSDNWRRNWISQNRPEDLPAHDKRTEEREEKRNKFKEKFPFTAILEGLYPEHDFITRWCWSNFGSPQCEKCYEYASEYPGCPLVLATEYIQTGWHDTKEGKQVEWQEKAYKEVEAHSHEGAWANFWLAKTGYDYGFMEYYFQSELDRDRFLAAIPIIQEGEKEKEGVE